MRRWRVGIAGCGIIAGGKDVPDSDVTVRSHAQAMTRTGRFEIKAVADPDQGRRNGFRNVWGGEAGFESVEEMLGETALDLLVVASPNRFHFDHIKAALSGKNRPSVVFAEKPVCLTAEELARLQELRSGSGVNVVVNHTRRFDPGHRKLADIIQSGRFGRMMKGRGVYYGGWKHNGIHLVDTLNMLVGNQPQVISSCISGPGKPGDPDLDVILNYGGTKISIESFDEAIYQLFEIELHFEDGRIRAVDFGGDIQVEEVIVNTIGERELKPCRDYAIKGLDSPMLHAYLTLDRILGGMDERIVDLDVAGASMKTIWDAEALSKP